MKNNTQDKALIARLQQVGLNEKEAQIYLANLSLGEASISDIAKRAEVKRTTVHEIMKSLLAQNIVSLTAKGKRKQYVVVEPE